MGVGPADPHRNPFVAARLPNLDRWLGGARLVADDVGEAGLILPGAAVRTLDATLGLPGLPQSGTGQTTLLMGVNAAAMMGRHFGPWVPTGLRARLAAENLFRAAAAGDRVVAFANAHPDPHPRPGDPGTRRPGAMPLAANAAGFLDRGIAAVRAGHALTAEITNERWRRHIDPDAPDPRPEEAGAMLARIASQNDLTVFAHYDTDLVGHRGGLDDAVAALERVDAFLGGLFAEIPGGTTVVIASDHGNVEDASAGHTRNPVPLVVIGERSDEPLDATSLEDVAPLILSWLGVQGDGAPP